MCAFGSSTPRGPRGAAAIRGPAGASCATCGRMLIPHSRMRYGSESAARRAGVPRSRARRPPGARGRRVFAASRRDFFPLVRRPARLRAGRLAHKSRARWGPSAFTFQDRYSQGLARRVAHGHAACVDATRIRCPCTMALSRVSPGSHVLGARERSRGPHTPLSPRASPGACAGALRGKMSANHLY